MVAKANLTFSLTIVFAMIIFLSCCEAIPADLNLVSAMITTLNGNVVFIPALIFLT